MSRVTVTRVAGRRLEVRTGDAVAIIDRPTAEGGAGDGFRSTDLLLGALGSCTIGTMLSFAEAEGIAVDGARAELTAITSIDTDTVTRAKLTLHLDGDLSEADLERLSKAAAECKIHRSLHSGIETTLSVVAD